MYSQTPGFTLIEMMLAVLLLALLSSAAALTFSGQLKEAQTRDSLEQLRSFDETTRLFARRYGHAEKIVFDLTANTLSRRDGPDGAAVRAQVSWPTGFWVDEIRVGSAGAVRSGSTIDVSASGISPSYAIRLRGPELDQWVLFAGLTGDMTKVPDEQTMATLLANGTRSGPWNPTRGHDAD